MATGGLFFFSPQICRFPHPLQGLAALHGSLLSAGPRARSLAAWGHAIHWGASSTRAWGRTAIPERGVIGWGEALLGCTEEDIRQERKKLRQTEEQAKKVRSKGVPSKDG